MRPFAKIRNDDKDQSGNHGSGQDGKYRQRTGDEAACGTGPEGCDGNAKRRAPPRRATVSPRCRVSRKCEAGTDEGLHQSAPTTSPMASAPIATGDRASIAAPIAMTKKTPPSKPAPKECFAALDSFQCPSPNCG